MEVQTSRDIAIVDAHGRRVSDGTPGRVGLFAATSPGQESEQWVETGLLGFIDEQGRLVITGQAGSEASGNGHAEAHSLSYWQQGLWLFSELYPESSTYNISVALRIDGRISLAALRHALTSVVERQDILRTTFTVVGGQPVQVVSREATVTPELMDLRHLSGDEQEQAAKRHIDDESRRTMSISTGPLMRVTLYRLAEDRYILQFVVHHIIFDGWSWAVLFQELSEFYNRYPLDGTDLMPDLPMQYGEYAERQRERFGSEQFRDSVAYWQKQLSGVPPLLELPLDHRRPETPSHRGKSHAFRLPREAAGAVRRVARDARSTNFMVLLAAFQALLHRYTGSEDIVTGSPIANRVPVEMEQLIGCFINTLVLRNDLGGNPTFRDLLAQVRQTTLGAMAHQEVPFDMLLETLDLPRNRRYNPLVQVLFILQNTPVGDLNLGGARVVPIATATGTAQTDLKLEIWESEDGFHCWMEYASDLFEEETIKRIADHFVLLVDQVTADPDTRIGDVHFLTEAERHQQVVEWNSTAAEYPRDRRIEQLFEEQVERGQDRTALLYEDTIVTYADLNRRANQLAHFLMERGAGPGSLIAVSLDRSPDLVATLLAILKTGAAYVPLDPSHPVERMGYILDDTRASLVITHQDLLESLPRPGVELINLDHERETLDSLPQDNPSHTGTADDLMYVVFTSGSTGVPKGVAGPHRGIVNRASWMWRTHPYEPDEILCQRVNLNFADHVCEIFTPLLAGMPSVIVPQGLERDPEALVALLAEKRITRVVLVPVFLRMLLNRDRPLGELLPDLRYLHASGEALDPDLLSSFRDEMPDTVLLNLYGSSEVSADATCYDSRDSAPTDRVVIGRPISNMRIYILDSDLRLLPVGAMGEICVGGDGVADGYLHSEDLTREKFVDDPFRPGERIYRTGDFGRFLPGGQIEYVGRRDFQVKIRGIRIELGEVEASLRQHPDVANVAATVLNDDSSEAQLVAYVVPAPGAHPIISDLRGFAKRRLPATMMPSHIVLLDRFPLTATGKIDRRALPKPERSRPDVESAFEAPSTPTEKELADIWEELLSLDRVGVNDDFFDLGGHSLVASRVLARVRSHFRVNIPLLALFEEPTIHGLAAAIDKRREEAGDELIEEPVSAPRVIPMPHLSLVAGGARAPQRSPLFFVPGINDAGFYCREMARGIEPVRPLQVLQSAQLVGESDRRSIEGIAAELLPALLDRQPRGPYALGGFCNGGMIAFEMARRLQERGEEVELLVLIATAGITPVGPLQSAATGTPSVNGRRRLRDLRGTVARQVVRTAAPAPAVAPSPRADIRDDPMGYVPRDVLGMMMQSYRHMLETERVTYDGRVAILWPAQDAWVIPHIGPTVGWSGIAPNAYVQIVPGGHITCVTDHVADLGRMLATIVD